MVDSIESLLAMAGDEKLSDLAVRLQAEQDQRSQDDVRAQMMDYLAVMRPPVEEGMRRDVRSFSGLVGGQAALLRDGVNSGKTVGGALLGMAAARAMAVAECNACMGRIVAAPTAGSCGILPAALLTAQEVYDLKDDQLVSALFTAALFGQVIAQRSTISGAEGGCQAECGAASAMAAAAMTEMMGGTNEMAAHACSFALMNLMGLVCDPVGGLVEVPCVYRNVAGVANAFTSADMALCGLKCPVPTDEVIDAMREVGESMPARLRETGEGGLAAAPSAQKLMGSLSGRI